MFRVFQWSGQRHSTPVGPLPIWRSSFYWDAHSIPRTSRTPNHPPDRHRGHWRTRVPRSDQQPPVSSSKHVVEIKIRSNANRPYSQSVSSSIGTRAEKWVTGCKQRPSAGFVLGVPAYRGIKTQLLGRITSPRIDSGAWLISRSDSQSIRGSCTRSALPHKQTKRLSQY